MTDEAFQIYQLSELLKDIVNTTAWLHYQY